MNFEITSQGVLWKSVGGSSFHTYLDIIIGMVVLMCHNIEEEHGGVLRVCVKESQKKLNEVWNEAAKTGYFKD